MKIHEATWSISVYLMLRIDFEVPWVISVFSCCVLNGREPEILTHWLKLMWSIVTACNIFIDSEAIISLLGCQGSSWLRLGLLLITRYSWHFIISHFKVSAYLIGQNNETLLIRSKRNAAMNLCPSSWMWSWRSKSSPQVNGHSFAQTSGCREKKQHGDDFSEKMAFCKNSRLFVMFELTPWQIGGSSSCDDSKKAIENKKKTRKINHQWQVFKKVMFDSQNLN